MFELDPVVQRLPFKYKCLFFLYTFPGGVYAIVALTFCLLNPFWFRNAAFTRLENQIHWFGRWRNKRMQKYYDKYSLLANIKNS